jgi:hypothetical protein
VYIYPFNQANFPDFEDNSWLQAQVSDGTNEYLVTDIVMNYDIEMDDIYCVELQVV